MDLSPKTLREVEFREKLRGYHPEDVDQFLERVAAGIEALQDKLRQTTERAVHAEELAAATGETDDALRRTLILAQKTADAAIQEAREQASEIVSTAQGEATSIVEEARQKAARLAAEAQNTLREDLAALEQSRSQLREEVGQLEQWIGEHRSALSAALSEALSQVQQGVFVAAPVPELAEVAVPAPPTIDAPVAGDMAGDETGDGAGGDEEADADGVAAATPFDQEVAGAADEDGGNELTAVPDDYEQDGPVIEHDENDAFMVELRRAVTDEEPLGPREDSDEPAPVAAPNDAAFYSDGDDDSRRFGPRRRRRR